MIIKRNTFDHKIQDYYATVPTAAPASADLIEVTVPVKSILRIFEVGNWTDTAAAWGTVYWDFFYDDTPLYPFQRIYNQIAFGLGRRRVQTVEILGGHKFRVTAFNPTAGNLVMGITLDMEYEYQE